jgi:alpha-maltose-1-phosphate synthase
MANSSDKQVLLICIGTFHFVNCANQLTQNGCSVTFFTGAPPWKVRRKKNTDFNVLHFYYFNAIFFAFTKLISKLNIYHSEGIALLFNRLNHYSFGLVAAIYILVSNSFSFVYALSGLGVLPSFAARIKGLKYIVDRSSVNPVCQRSILLGEAKRMNILNYCLPISATLNEIREYLCSDKVIAPSWLVRNSFVECPGIYDKTHVVRPYINPDIFVPSVKEFSSIGKPIVTFVGNATLEKGVHLLCSAFLELGLESLALLQCVGSVPTKNFQKLLYHRGLDKSKISFSGPVPNNCLPAVYNSSSLVVLPSLQDGFGMVALEAALCGTPILVSCHAGASEIITSGVIGEIFDPLDHQSFPLALQRMIDKSLAESFLDRTERASIVRADMEKLDYANSISNVLLES